MVAARKLCIQARTQEQDRPHMYEFLLELASAVERAICFGQTGNAKVICNDVMAHLLLKPSLLLQGVPTIDKRFLPRGGKFSWNLNDWPMTRSGRPQSAARATIDFWYGAPAAEVSIHNV
jgi:hypothetical protein